MGINRELFQKSSKFQRPSSVLRDLYNTDNKKKNNILLDMIESGLSDLKTKLKRCLKLNYIKQWILLKRFLSLIDKIKRDKD